MCRFHTGKVINYIIPLFFSSTLSSLCPSFYIDYLSKAAGGLDFRGLRQISGFIKHLFC